MAAPVLVDGRCVTACPLDTYQSGGTCYACSPTCASCSGPGLSACTACSGDRALLGGECLLDCPDGYFAEADHCALCHGSCATCSSRDVCTSCKGQDMLQPDGLCAAGCPEGWGACPATNKCTACPAQCAQCEPSGPSCDMVCTKCKATFFLSSGACHGSCPAGEFAAPGSGICQACDSACRSCFGSASFCTGCDGGLLHLDEGVCVSACPSASAPVGGVCLHCLDKCEQCEPAADQPQCAIRADGALECPEIATCSACVSGHLLLGGAACVEVCPAGYFADLDGQPAVCAPCHASCTDSCLGPGEDECTYPRRNSKFVLGLAVGLSVGLLLLLILLILVVLFLIRRRRQRGGALGKTPHDEDATMLNTIVELALPGAILVNVDLDFRPMDKTLGAGTQASVYVAQTVGSDMVARLGCPDIVAIKKMKSQDTKPLHVAMFQNEVALMWLLREHGNIVRLFGYSQSPPAIVMERYDTDLATLLHSAVELSAVQLLDICQQWASGLEAMHANGVAHCDLKPGNVFASQRPDGGWRVALGDLGTSKNLSADRSSALILTMPKLNALSARYAAPELLAAVRRGTALEQHLLFPADIYAAAILLNECLSRTIPWDGLSLQQISDAVQVGDRPPVGGDPPAGLMDLVHAAWQPDPERRPAAAIFRQQCSAFFVAADGLSQG
ncbi:TKL protein kinase [Fonticula alba]|uniref:TKL protein kinase n=1 Tax=Fonticula alba TaxID=691883 RepID=A0A058Z376_FONAL|nr:TKL protein kinase [Fonticula alba]KCV68378.1 TKL protein kinase [Fonticula alba]|eukprot:XP_009497432.1 TKL protein kinase [Fonticula alba]